MKLLTLLFSLFLFIQSSDLDSLRNAYPKAGDSKENAAKFEKLTENSGNSSVEKAYKAAAIIIKSKFEPLKTKLSGVKIGIKSLENVVNSSPNEIEVRLIRLSIQENLPGIVGYKSDIKEDKAFIQKNYSKEDQATKNYIKGFVNNSKIFSSAERSAFK